MSQCEGGIPLNFVAAADLSAKQYFFVKKTATDSEVDLQTTDGGSTNTIGVLQNDPLAGEAAAVFTAKGGRTSVMCGGSFNPGDLVSCDTAGKAVKAGTSDTVLAIAVSAGASGSIASVIFK